MHASNQETKCRKPNRYQTLGFRDSFMRAT